ncbi:hypothetical protein KEM55_002054 [Ascosphaera atra]|nr:hypothetical protein KEM55_002054 [Ascosphaera atra]
MDARVPDQALASSVIIYSYATPVVVAPPGMMKIVRFDHFKLRAARRCERIARGKYKAVPHFVKGANVPAMNVARNTLAVFTQPDLEEEMEDGKTFARGRG